MDLRQHCQNYMYHIKDINIIFNVAISRLCLCCEYTRSCQVSRIRYTVSNCLAVNKKKLLVLAFRKWHNASYVTKNILEKPSLLNKSEKVNRFKK